MKKVDFNRSCRWVDGLRLRLLLCAAYHSRWAWIYYHPLGKKSPVEMIIFSVGTYQLPTYWEQEFWILLVNHNGNDIFDKPQS